MSGHHYTEASLYSSGIEVRHAGNFIYQFQIFTSNYFCGIFFNKGFSSILSEIGSEVFIGFQLQDSIYNCISITWTDNYSASFFTDNIRNFRFLRSYGNNRNPGSHYTNDLAWNSHTLCSFP